MKWVTNRIGKEQIWYSADVIKKIEEIALKTCECCEDCTTEFNIKEECEIYEIKKILNEEEK